MRLSYLVTRTLSLLFVLLTVSLVTYGLIGLTPGDPARTALAAQYDGDVPPPEAVDEFRAEQGLDQPLYIQYIDWIRGAVRGDLGTAFTIDRPVTDLIVEQLPATLMLATSAMILSMLIGVPAGIISAVYKGTPIDSVGRLFALFGLSMPNFWFGYLLIILFALTLDLLPVSGTGSLSHLVLPTITLALGSAAVLTRLVRVAVLETLSEPYIRTAQAKGLKEHVVVFRHALRTAMIPIITVLGLQYGYVLNGAIVVEIVFQRPGIGALLVDAVFARDYPLIQGVTLFAAVTFVLLNFLVDVTYAVIDPRVQMGGEPS